MLTYQTQSQSTLPCVEQGHHQQHSAGPSQALQQKKHKNVTKVAIGQRGVVSQEMRLTWEIAVNQMLTLQEQVAACALHT
jgi:hypothetical protein